MNENKGFVTLNGAFLKGLNAAGNLKKPQYKIQFNF